MQQDRAAVELPRTYRNPALRQNQFLVPAILLGGVVVIGGPLHTLAVWVVLAVVWILLCAWLVPLFGRIRVVADADGLLVVNYLSTQRIPWAQVRSIGEPLHLTAPAGVIELIDGQHVKARALGTVGIAMGAAYVMRARLELQTILAAQQGRPGDAPAIPEVLAQRPWRR